MEKKHLVLITDHLSLLWQKKRLVVLIALLCTLLGALRVVYGPRTYQAQATLLVSPPPFRVAGGEEISGLMPKTLNVEDYKHLLQSYGVKEQAVDNLEGSPYWTEEELEALRSPSALAGMMRASTAVIEKTPQAIVYSVVITLTARADRPERAAALVQAWATAGIELVRQYTGTAARTSVDFLEGEYQNVDKVLLVAEDDLNLSQNDYAIKLEEYDNDTDELLDTFEDETDTLVEAFELETDLQVAAFEAETDQSVADFEDETDAQVLAFDHATDDLLTEFEDATKLLLAKFDDETDVMLQAFDDATDIEKMEFDDETAVMEMEFDDETDAMRDELDDETDRLLMAFDDETDQMETEFDAETKQEIKTLRDAHQEKTQELEAELKIRLAEDEISLLSTVLHEYKRNLIGVQQEQQTQEKRLEQLQEELDEHPKYVVVSKSITDDALWDKLEPDVETGTLPEQLDTLRLRSEMLNPVHDHVVKKIIDCRVNLETLPVQLAYIETATEREHGEYDDLYHVLKGKQFRLDEAGRTNALELDLFELTRLLEKDKLVRGRDTAKEQLIRGHTTDREQLLRERDTSKTEQIVRRRNTDRERLVRSRETEHGSLVRSRETEGDATARAREMDKGKLARERETEKKQVTRERTRLLGDLERERNVKKLALTRGRETEQKALTRERGTMAAKLKRGRDTDQDILLREGALAKERLARLVGHQKQKYEALADRYLTARLAAADDTADIALVGSVVTPDLPVGVSWKARLAAAAILGLAVGLFVVLLNYWLRWLYAAAKEPEQAPGAAQA